jgi:hypothetical protein
MASSPLITWFSHWLPVVPLDKDFRYNFKTNLNEPPAASQKALSLTEWAQSSLTALLPWRRNPPSEAQDLEPQLSLDSMNLVNILTSAPTASKDESLRKSNISIAFAVISKPKWIFTDMDQLLEEACLNANIALFTQIPHFESAIRLANEAGKSNPLVLEQSSYHFNLLRRSSSMSADELHGAFIPGRLTSEMLQAQAGFEGTAESLNKATIRLVQEIASAKKLLRYEQASEPDRME